jgi:hypothetical protein
VRAHYWVHGEVQIRFGVSQEADHPVEGPTQSAWIDAGITWYRDRPNLVGVLALYVAPVRETLVEELPDR